MRRPKYLSPSALGTFLKEGTEKYYLKYLADNRPPRDPQTEPMSVGSAFDAYAKSYLHGKLFGGSHTNSNMFLFETIFEQQVEAPQRDFARIAGLHCFEQYKSSGALLDLLMELQKANTEPRFEFEVCGTVSANYPHTDGVTPGDVILLGKPDVYYTNKHGTKIILDWKVNGYCSNYPKSPSKGYVKLRSENKTAHGYHKDASLFEHGGVTINIAGYFEHVDQDWSRQLSTYAWLLGEDVGGDYIVAIDQLCCSPAPGKPKIRVAEHRMRVSPKFQFETFGKYCKLWDLVHSDHIFEQMTLEESQSRCGLLEEQAYHLYGPAADPMFNEMTQR